jgi:hypothetical protein
VLTVEILTAAYSLGGSAVLRSSQQELIHGIHDMLGKSQRNERALPPNGASLGVQLGPGEEIRIEGIPDVADRAALDYAEMVPASPSYGPN